MPMIKDCPICGQKQINHGFDITNGGMYFYHTNENRKDWCYYYEGDDHKIYKNALDLFKGVVEPRTPKTKENIIWIKARIADLSNHPRKAKKLYEQWDIACRNR
jgi:hypothetical protein